MRISDWSSDVCSSDLPFVDGELDVLPLHAALSDQPVLNALIDHRARVAARRKDGGRVALRLRQREPHVGCRDGRLGTLDDPVAEDLHGRTRLSDFRSEEHQAELQSLMRIPYAVL